MAQSNDTRLPALQLTMLRIEHNPHKSPLPGQAALWVELTAAGTERCNLDDLSKQQFDGIMAELRKAQA